MPNDEVLEVKGELREISSEGTYRVAIRAGHEVLCTLAGDLAASGASAGAGEQEPERASLRPGDRVLVQVAADDLEHGRIVHRYGQPGRRH